jgi:hypothetical protein
MRRYNYEGRDEHMPVTPEMIEAGIAVFRARDAFDLFGDETLKAIAREVFAAMVSPLGY